MHNEELYDLYSDDQLSEEETGETFGMCVGREKRIEDFDEEN